MPVAGFFFHSAWFMANLINITLYKDERTISSMDRSIC